MAATGEWIILLYTRNHFVFLWGDFLFTLILVSQKIVDPGTKYFQ